MKREKLSKVFYEKKWFDFTENNFLLKLGTIFILRNDIEMGGGSENGNFFLNLCTDFFLRKRVGGSKKTKTPLRNIKKIVPWESNFYHDTFWKLRSLNHFILSAHSNLINKIFGWIKL